MEKVREFIKNNKNKILIGILVIIVVALPIIISQVLKQQNTQQHAESAPQMTMSLSPSTKQVELNQTFTVDLMLDASTNDVGSLDFTVEYDKTHLSLVGDIKPETFQLAKGNDSSNGYHVILINPLITPITGSNVKIGTLTFKIIKDGPTSITIDNAKTHATATGSDTFVNIRPSAISAVYSTEDINISQTPGVSATPVISPSSTPTPTPTPPNTCTATTSRPPACTCNSNSQCRSGLCQDGKCAAQPITTIPDGSTGLGVSVIMIGIGKINDDNPTPINTSRLATVQIFDSSNQPVEVNGSTSLSVPIIFDATTGQFNGLLNLGTSFTTGNYTMKIKLDNTLYKRIPGILNIKNGQTNNWTDGKAPTAVTLVSGDIDQDNKMGIQDYTNFVSCAHALASCTPDMYELSDFNDNGDIDALDIHLLDVGFATREGD